MYLLSPPLYWTIQRNPAEKAAVYFVYKVCTSVLTRRGTLPSTRPPSSILDYLVETIRTNAYKDLERTTKTKYVYEDKLLGKKEVYTDDDLLPSLEYEKKPPEEL